MLIIEYIRELMSTVGRKPLTAEQKQRKNEMAKERRLKNKMDKVQHELSDLEETRLPIPEPIVIKDDTDEIAKRKLEIAEKRKKSLELARSKIKSRTQIRNEKDEEMDKIRQENERIKSEAAMLLKQKEEELNKVREEKQKVKKVIKYIPQEVVVKKKKEPQQIIAKEEKQEPTFDYLAQQSYAEQLQRKMRDTIMNKIMADTFG